MEGLKKYGHEVDQLNIGGSCVQVAFRSYGKQLSTVMGLRLNIGGSNNSSVSKFLKFHKGGYKKQVNNIRSVRAKCWTGTDAILQIFVIYVHICINDVYAVCNGKAVVKFSNNYSKLVNLNILFF